MGKPSAIVVRQARYRLCISPGCGKRIFGEGLHCSSCYRSSPEGQAETNAATRRRYWERKEAERIAAGLPIPAIHCRQCRLWENRCTIGIPEGIGRFAEECSAFASMFGPRENPLHPENQQQVQDRLERAYLAAGRQDPSHPFHAVYTDVFGELKAKQITVE